MNIFLESSGSLVSASIIKSIQSAGFRAIASDISYESVGRYLSDEFVLSPKKNDPMLWDKFKKIMIEYKVHV